MLKHNSSGLSEVCEFLPILHNPLPREFSPASDILLTLGKSPHTHPLASQLQNEGLGHIVANGLSTPHILRAIFFVKMENLLSGVWEVRVRGKGSGEWAKKKKPGEAWFLEYTMEETLDIWAGDERGEGDQI